MSYRKKGISEKEVSKSKTEQLSKETRTSTRITGKQGGQSSVELMPCAGLPSQSVACLLFVGFFLLFFFL